MSEERKNVLPINLVHELQSYGLTEGQARLYLYLAGRSPVHARTIASNVTLHRVDIYRKLRELEELGLVETYLAFPKRYSAVSTNIAINILLRRMQSRMMNMKNLSRGTKQKLDQYIEENQNRGRNVEADTPETAETYKFVVGRKRYYQEVHTMLRNAQREVLRVISANGIRRIFLSGFYRDYAGARERGVNIKMISEITPENRKNAKELSRLLELRHLENVHIRLAVIDQCITTFGARIDDENLSGQNGNDSYLFSNDPRLAETARFMFEQLWDAAETVDFRRL